ncbi:glycosyltransferase family 4 protein [uncultured Roseobacter sp.]|uniref:glycosyltransferase family 4 protein n=1 Tax=uncultured Roseobacter sp. TaxID=114847 RepID=UPI0026304757|nr:glycosyltransferase family 4 protein [uncultured Roseobacter sp.]
MQVDTDATDVIAPNLKRRYSGVSSTVFRLVPVQAEKIAIATTGPVLPDDIPQFPLSRLPFMSRSGPSGFRVWHARRNIEMLVGVLLKYVLRKRLKLVFTSAAQRRRGEYSRWLIRRMDAVIAASGKANSYLEVPATVILHGIDAEEFAPPGDRAALRSRLGLDPDALIVGCFGRIREQKGTDLFVDAMIDLLPRHPKAQGIIMGGVTREQQAFVDGLKSRAEAAGLADRLRILPEDKGFTIAPWFQASDIYVAPQRWEGFGLTPLEAMSCGVPVVATRVGAFEDLVVPGETGFLVPPEDISELIAATDRLMTDTALRQSMAAAARRKVVAQHQIEHEAEAITAVYRRLIAEG